MTEHSTRAVRFAAAYALLRMAEDLGDRWVAGVSLPVGSRRLRPRRRCAWRRRSPM